jgi:hypothetical protein
MGSMMRGVHPFAQAKKVKGLPHTPEIVRIDGGLLPL